MSTTTNGVAPVGDDYTSVYDRIVALENENADPTTPAARLADVVRELGELGPVLDALSAQETERIKREQAPFLPVELLDAQGSTPQGAPAASSLILPGQPGFFSPQAAAAAPKQTPQEAHAWMVAEAVRKLRVTAEARRLLAAEQLPPRQLPVLQPLDWRLSLPVDPVTYRVAGLWPAGGNVVLSAQRKAGKTTAVMNLVRSLADGDPFLGEATAGTFWEDLAPAAPHQVTPLGYGRRVALVDLELTPAMLDQWLREQGIRNTGSVVVINLRGRSSSFAITDDRCRADWAQQLRLASVDVLIVDPLAPALAACGLNENEQADVNTWTQAFDALKYEAGVAEGLVVHHMGHDGERARGSSRLRDWPDAEWKIQRSESPTAPRYFSADGRDVQVAEQQLRHDGRRLVLVGGSKAEDDEAFAEARDAVIAYVTHNPGCSRRDVETNAGLGKRKTAPALKYLTNVGALVLVAEGQAHRHYIPGDQPGADGS